MSTTATASHVISGEVTMLRIAVDRSPLALFGPLASIVDNWREQFDRHSSALNLTMMRTGGGRYIALIWSVDPQMLDECREHGLPEGLAVELYAVGTLGEHVTSDDTARACGLELARLVARAELPWPPQDETDYAVWRTAGSLVVDRSTTP